MNVMRVRLDTHQRWKYSLGLLQHFDNLIISSFIISSPSQDFFHVSFPFIWCCISLVLVCTPPSFQAFSWMCVGLDASVSLWLMMISRSWLSRTAWLKSDSKRITRALISMIAFPALWPRVCGLRGLFGKEIGHVWCNNDKRVHSWQLCCGNLKAYSETEQILALSE